MLQPVPNKNDNVIMLYYEKLKHAMVVLQKPNDYRLQKNSYLDKNIIPVNN